jgi:hypothetical protein
MRIVVNNQPKGNLDFIMRPISLKLYIFTGYEVQASLKFFKELDSSLRWKHGLQIPLTVFAQLPFSAVGR